MYLSLFRLLPHPGLYSYLSNRPHPPSALTAQGTTPSFPLTSPADHTSLCLLTHSGDHAGLHPDMPSGVTYGHSTASLSTSLLNSQFQPDPTGISSRSLLQTTPVKKESGLWESSKDSMLRRDLQAGRKSAWPVYLRTSGDHRYWASPSLGCLLQSTSWLLHSCIRVLPCDRAADDSRAPT